MSKKHAEVPQMALGQRVRVFNQVSDDFTGVVRRINKRTVLVEADAKFAPFTNHPNGRNEDAYERETFLVPFRDVTILDNAPSVEPVVTKSADGSGSPKSEVPPAAAEELLKAATDIRKNYEAIHLNGGIGRCYAISVKQFDALCSAIDAARET